MLHGNIILMLTTLYINIEHTIPYVPLLSFSYHIVFVKHCSWTITLSAILRVYLVEIPDNVNQYQAQNRWLSSGNLEGIIIAQKHTPSHSGLGVT